MFVEAVAVARVVRTVHAIGVNLARSNAFDPYMPDVARPVVHRVECHRLVWKSIVKVHKEKEAHCRGAAAEDGKLGPVVVEMDTQGQGITRICPKRPGAPPRQWPIMLALFHSHPICSRGRPGRTYRIF